MGLFEKFADMLGEGGCRATVYESILMGSNIYFKGILGEFDKVWRVHAKSHSGFENHKSLCRISVGVI